MVKIGKYLQAYDLLNVQLHLPEDKEESVLTIVEKKNFKSDFINLGIKIRIKLKNSGEYL